MSVLEKNIQDLFNSANKLIFVQEYAKAFAILNKLVNKHPEARDNLLIQLRRIELACKLSLSSQILEEFRKLHEASSTMNSEILIAMTAQQAHLVPNSASIKTYSDLTLKYGESAAAYYGIALGLEAEGNSDRALFNYQQSLQKDASWYPSFFGMSQIYYHQNDYVQGHHFFYLFEQLAPYALYGNVETHKSLSFEFLRNKQYHEAEQAIRSLTQWWIDSRKHCPLKYKILESLMMSLIEKEKGNNETSETYKQTAHQEIESLLKEPNLEVDDLKYLTRVLKDFEAVDFNTEVYKNILKHSLEPNNIDVKLYYASFLIAHDSLDEGYALLKKLSEQNVDEETRCQIQALYSRYFELKKDYDDAIARISLALEVDPWNLEYIAQAIRCQMSALYGEDYVHEPMTLSKDLSNIGKDSWSEFDRTTTHLSAQHQSYLVYNRSKLRFLYSGGKEDYIYDFIEKGIIFDPSKAAHECLKLLNTNFETPFLFWCLGVLFKEAGFLEISELWFEILLNKSGVPNELRLQTKIDLSDSYNWRGVNLQKALGYLKFVNEADARFNELAFLKMAHTHLKLGEMRQARECLNKIKNMGESIEFTYLQGLLSYRDGSLSQAKTIWKPILTANAITLRDHRIKQEILAYYFDKKQVDKAS